MIYGMEACGETVVVVHRPQVNVARSCEPPLRPHTTYVESKGA